MAKGLWVILNVDNVDKSLEFYKAVGLKAAREEAGPLAYGAVYATPDSGLVLWNKNAVAPDQPADTRAWLSGELGKGVLVAVGVPNAERLWQKVQAARLTVETPLRAQDWGGKEFTVVDPDGYVVNVTDKFPGGPAPAKKAKRAVKKAKAAVKRVAAKGRAKAGGKRKGK